MGKLNGKVALITGAARGQGRAHAVRLAEEGADIVAIDACTKFESVSYELPTEADLDETASLVKGADRRVIAYRGDVRSRTDLQSALDRALAEFGRLDIVVANAGIMPTLGPASNDDVAWYEAIDVMLTGVFLTVEVCVPTLIQQGSGGSLVLISSTAGLRGLARSRSVATAGMLGYQAAKHGVVGLMRAYANSLAEHSIRVNSVHPTGVNTPMIVNEQFAEWAAQNQSLREALQNALPVGRVEPDDVANAVAWLCSDDARYVTGQTLGVDAGFLVR